MAQTNAAPGLVPKSMPAKPMKNSAKPMPKQMTMSKPMNMASCGNDCAKLHDRLGMKGK